MINRNYFRQELVQVFFDRKKDSEILVNSSLIKVTFKDLCSGVAVGQQLDILPRSVLVSRGDQVWNVLVDSKMLLKYENISLDVIRDLEEKFALILNNTGLYDKEKVNCVDYQKDNLSFTCFLEHVNKCIQITLLNDYKFCLEDGNVRMIYNVDLPFVNLIEKNINGDNYSCCYQYNKYLFNCEVLFGEYSISVSLTFEEKYEEVLFKDSFIDDVKNITNKEDIFSYWQVFYDNCLINVGEIREIDIKVIKSNVICVGNISLVNGNLKKYILKYLSRIFILTYSNINGYPTVEALRENSDGSYEKDETFLLVENERDYLDLREVEERLTRQVSLKRD